MNQSRRREKFKGRRQSGTFFMIPTAVLASPSFTRLSFKAKALLLNLGEQYRGFNNGDLAAVWSLLRDRGWKSKDTLQKAKIELLDSGLIEKTRQGGLHQADLFAFTWIEVHDCGGKLDIAATRIASHRWRLNGTLVNNSSAPSDRSEAPIDR